VCGAYADSCFVCQIVAKKIVFFCTNAKRKSARMGEGKVESKEEVEDEDDDDDDDEEGEEGEGQGQTNDTLD